MWRWRRVATADQIGGKRESEVKVTSGYRRRAENVWCLNSLLCGRGRGVPGQPVGGRECHLFLAGNRTVL